MPKISAYTALSSLADTDQFVVVDTSDTTMASTGTTKKIPTSDVVSAIVALASFLSAVGEASRDAVGTALTAGTGVTITPNDGGDTITISLHADLVDLITAWAAASASGPATISLLEDSDNGVNKVTVTAPASLAGDVTATLPSTTGTLANTSGAGGPPVTLTFVLSDETTALTTGTKLTYEIPFAFTLTEAPKASLTTAGTGTTVDIKESGTTIFTNKIVFDSGETSITTAATPPSLADSSIAANAVLTFIVDATAGAAAGLKVSLTGYRT